MGYMDDFNLLIRENFDIMDTPTRKCVVALEDAEQSQLLSALSSALYDKIVEKVDKIDFGTIPRSRGDITKVDGFDQTEECLKIMRQLVIEYKEDPAIVDSILTAIENIKNRKNIFMKAYALNIEMPMVFYNLIVMAIEQSVSFLIAVCIQYIKDPSSQSMVAALDKVAYNNTKDNLLYEQISKFNETCASGDLDKLFSDIIKTGGKIHESDTEFEDSCGGVNTIVINVGKGNGNGSSCPEPKDGEKECEDKKDSLFAGDDKEKENSEDGKEDSKEVMPTVADEPANPEVLLTPEEPVEESFSLAATWLGAKALQQAAIVGGIALTGGSVAMTMYKLLIKVVIPMMRSITYFLYNSKMQISDCLATQAQFLEVNAYKLQYTTNIDMDDSKRAKVIQKQLKIADKLKSWANKFAIDSKKAKKDANELAQSEAKKMKIDELKDELPADVYSKSVLF